MHDLPHGQLPVQRQPDHQPYALLGGKLAASDAGLATDQQGLLDPVLVNELRELRQSIGGRMLQGLGKRILKKAQNKKGTC